MSESFDRESRAIKDAWRAERARLAGWPAVPRLAEIPLALDVGRRY
jgi:hypothetical protein